jgi:hypothetical protein
MMEEYVKIHIQPGVVVNLCNPSTQEVEERGL